MTYAIAARHPDGTDTVWGIDVEGGAIQRFALNERTVSQSEFTQPVAVGERIVQLVAPSAGAELLDGDAWRPARSWEYLAEVR